MLTEYRKDLMHMAINGKYELLPIIHQLSRYRDCDKFLGWLIKNNITGQNLLEWIQLKHKNSVLSMVKFIIKSHNKNREDQPILFNRDWV